MVRLLGIDPGLRFTGWGVLEVDGNRLRHLGDGVIATDSAESVPDRLKVRDGMGKFLLRRWLDGKLPAAEPFSKKRGFTVPVGEWIAARRLDVGPLVARQPGIAELCRPDAVEALFRAEGKRAGFACWTLLFYALWHRRHVLGLKPAGDALETLAHA